jgi:hypothetical protein
MMMRSILAKKFEDFVRIDRISQKFKQKFNLNDLLISVNLRPKDAVVPYLSLIY